MFDIVVVTFACLGLIHSLTHTALGDALCTSRHNQRDDDDRMVAAAQPPPVPNVSHSRFKELKIIDKRKCRVCRFCVNLICAAALSLY